MRIGRGEKNQVSILFVASHTFKDTHNWKTPHSLDRVSENTFIDVVSTFMQPWLVVGKKRNTL